MTAWMWLLAIVAGAAMLGVFNFYGQQKTQQPEPIETKLRRDAATRETYRKADGGES